MADHMAVLLGEGGIIQFRWKKVPLNCFCKSMIWQMGFCKCLFCKELLLFLVVFVFVVLFVCLFVCFSWLSLLFLSPLPLYIRPLPLEILYSVHYNWPYITCLPTIVRRTWRIHRELIINKKLSRENRKHFLNPAFQLCFSG